ncbi:hypothetical protein, partial [Pseudomonas chlororaphis]|uniref:hypothetical protein n=1 Tax=Pseudomonas chlororaphis TaxID=587753 RepID=UPI001B32566B
MLAINDNAMCQVIRAALIAGKRPGCLGVSGMGRSTGLLPGLADKDYLEHSCFPLKRSHLHGREKNPYAGRRLRRG